jgi:DNA-binding MarR family transcriptional regulator
VARRRSATDRRRQELTLTPQGSAALESALQAIVDHERHFTARFTEEELRVLFDALARIHQQV